MRTSKIITCFARNSNKLTMFLYISQALSILSESNTKYINKRRQASYRLSYHISLPRTFTSSTATKGNTKMTIIIIYTKSDTEPTFAGLNFLFILFKKPQRVRLGPISMKLSTPSSISLLIDLDQYVLDVSCSVKLRRISSGSLCI